METYVNPSSVLGVGILFILLGLIAVGARFGVRYRKSGIGVDDWLCALAYILVIGECSIMIYGSRTHTVGSHSPSNLGPELPVYLDDAQILLEKLETSFDLIQVPALMTIRLAVLFFYRRIFQGKIFNKFSWGLIVFVVLWAVTFFVSILAACGKHFNANLQDLAALKSECANTFVILICLAVLDVAVDLVILTMPIPLVWPLKMPIRRKFAVVLTLMVGGLAIACGITRTVLFGEILAPKLESTSEVAGRPSDDDLGVVSVLMFWGMLEMGVAIVAICLPTLRPLFKGWSPEGIISAFRSVFSLQSLGSSRRTRLSDRESGPHAAGSESQTSFAKPENLYPGLDSVNGTYAMRPVISTSKAGAPPQGEIAVNREVIQSVDAV